MPRAKKQTVPNTHVLLIADRSGSMTHLRDAVISQMNEFLTDRKNDPGDVRVTFFTFDTEFKTVFDDVPAKDVRELTYDDYEPRGSTALFDAIARSVTALENKVGTGERALVSIVTDGQENSSQEYALHLGGKSRIKALIERLEGKGNWTFTYLSADINAFADAQSIGINVGNIAQFDPTVAGLAQGAQTHRVSTANYSVAHETQSKSFYKK